MKRNIASLVFLVLVGCASKPEPKSYVLQPGTKIIMRGHDDAYEARKTFRDQTDYWRSGMVVEIKEALVLTVE